LAALFGPELEKRDGGFAVREGTGGCSLGCFAPIGHVMLDISRFGRLRCHFAVDEGDADLSVTDLRLYEPDQSTVRSGMVDIINGRLAGDSPCLLSLGLARPWQARGDSERRHWLQ